MPWLVHASNPSASTEFPGKDGKAEKIASNIFTAKKKIQQPNNEGT